MSLFRPGGRARRGFAAVLAAFLLWAAPCFSATLEVGPGSAFSTPGEAVGAARPGDTVEVRPGTYPGFTVDKSLTLTGVDYPVIDGGGAGTVVVITAPGVAFTGFRVTSSGADLSKDDAGVFVAGSASGAVVKDNVVDDAAFGIWVNGAAGIKVIGNRVSGKTELISQKRGNGIHLWNVADGLVEDNRVSQARDGIFVSVTGDTLIKDNTVTDLRYGVHYMYADDNRLVGNTTRGCRAGLALMFSKRLDITGNLSYDNEEYGILMRDIRDSRITDNVVAGNGKGLFFYNSLFNEVRENLVSDNSIGAHVWAGSVDNRVFGNTFLRNKTQVKYVGAEDEQWSRRGRGNYWSDYLGWDLDHDGVGDVPYEANTLMERLVWAYPAVKLLLNSPAVQTLRMVERQFPVIRPPGIVDSFPLMRPAGDKWKEWTKAD